MHRIPLFCLAVLATMAMASAAMAKPQPARVSQADIIKNAAPGDWRRLDPDNTLVMELQGKPVIIELAPRFAPQHVANIRILTREGFYTGIGVVRVQDNYVTQWADPYDEDKDKAKPLGSARASLPAEFSIAYKGLPLSHFKDADGWAPVSGFVDGMPVAADPAKNKAWIAHCYGVVGAARGNPLDSSNGTSLYAIIGQAHDVQAGLHVRAFLEHLIDRVVDPLDHRGQDLAGVHVVLVAQRHGRAGITAARPRRHGFL